MEGYSEEFDPSSSLSMSGLDDKQDKVPASVAGAPNDPPNLSRDLSFSPLPHGPGTSQEAPLSLSNTHAQHDSLANLSPDGSVESGGSIGKPLPSQSPITPSTKKLLEESAAAGSESEDERELTAAEREGAAKASPSSPEQVRARRNLDLMILSEESPALPPAARPSPPRPGTADSAALSPFASSNPQASHSGLAAIRALTSLELRTDSEGEEMHKRMFLGGAMSGLGLGYGSERESTMSVLQAIDRDLQLDQDPLHPVESVQMAIRTLAKSRGTASSSSAKESSDASLLDDTLSAPIGREAGGQRAGASPAKGKASTRDALEEASKSPSRIPKPKPASKAPTSRPSTSVSPAKRPASSSTSMAQKARGLREKLGRTSAPSAAPSAPPAAPPLPRPQTAAPAPPPVPAKPPVRPATASAGVAGGARGSVRESARQSGASTASLAGRGGPASQNVSSLRASSTADLSSLAGELHELQSRLSSMQSHLARASVDASLSRSIKDGDAARELARGLAHSIETLRSRLDAEVAARSSLAAESSALSQRHKEELKRLRESLEGRLREKQREVLALQKRVQELEGVQQEARARVLAAPSGPEAQVILTGEELRKLRAEIQEQEVLIRGYQAENEAAMLQLKERRKEDRRREDELLEMVQRLERQLREAELEARRGGQGAGAAGGHLKETLKLQSELEAMREAAEEAGRLHRAEVERLRKELQEERSKAQQGESERQSEEASMVRALQAELAATWEQSRLLVEGLERRLRAQEAATQAYEGQGQLIRDQAATIAVLENRLRSQGSGEAAWAARQAALEAEVAQWKGRAQAGEQEHESREKALRLQYEKRVADLEARLAHLSQLQGEATPGKAGPGQRPESPGSPEESTSPTLAPQPSPSRTTSALLLAKKEHRLKDLEGTLALRDQEIAALRQRIAAVESELQQAKAKPSEPAPAGPSSDAVQALHLRIEELSVQCSEMQRQLAAAAAPPEPQPESAWQRRAEASEMALQAVQRAHMQAVERALMLQTEHQRHLERLSEDLASRIVEARARAEEEAQARVRGQVESLEKELREAREALQGAAKEAATLRAVSQGWKPEARDYAELERRIAAMEEERRSKEAHWRQVVEEARRVHTLQQTLLRQKMELALESKNREIERFRAELDAILEAAVTAQQQVGGGMAASAAVVH